MKKEENLGEVVRLRMSRDTERRLEKVCKETGRSRSDVMRILIESALDVHEGRK